MPKNFSIYIINHILKTIYIKRFTFFMKDTNLVRFKNKYYSLGGVLRRSMEVSLSGGASTEYVNEQDAILSGVSEGNFVNISGDIMGGPLYLNGNPTLAMQAATKQYVDAQVSTVSGLAGGNYVSISGDTMVGSLAITNGNLSIKTHADYLGSDCIETTAACQTIGLAQASFHQENPIKFSYLPE